MPAPETYYSRTVATPGSRPALTGKIEADTVIVGGGLAGLTTALELARAGQSVVVLEAESIGFGASGRNGGIVSPSFACGNTAIARRVGIRAARELHRLTIEGVERLRATISDLKIDSADPCPGVLHLRRHDAKADLIAHAEEFACDFNYRLEYLDRDALRGLLVSDRYFHGLRDSRAFHIHPLNTLRGIAAEVERLGGKVFDASPATGAALTGAVKTITTPQGQVQARRVVFAMGGYTGALVPRLQRAVLPIATYMLLTEAAPDLLSAAIRTSDAVLDDRRAADYYRLVEGGTRLLWGGRITTRAASPAELARELRREMLGVFPQLADLKTDLAWSGQMGYARHLMPQIGQMAPDVWHCTAFGGHGLNTTAIGGKVLAEAILGETDRIAMFAPFGLPWAGGPLGLAAAQLTYWKLQAQDWWRERRR
ncbi:NAD(P)/FAD-dependent oxidoreductase [Rhodobacter ferrooxidans]|uniref:FAD dependent oxidoreductase n=1 Tax=Rhodobacter ferrooxidans TaxID=371731 RepID=C8RY00_9RHOB|nr:FAD-binding oxidoreductase [Rhodobacter sp. SW2]EEW26398.1 FAD dependent oxidoreductase [Rhodobacter sp. SW2]